jgi:tRNA-dihydrouridine synthase B
MNTDGYMTHPARLVKHLVHHSKEEHLIAQIYWGNPDTLVHTAQDIESKYPHFMGIELNIGCPSPKVIACGGWSGMMRDKSQCLQIIKDISKSISKPFSIKVRIGLNKEDQDQQYSMLLQAAPYCHTISIHGRTLSQGHSGDVNRNFISKIKSELGSTCNILGNGWVNSYEQAQELQNTYKIDGIMIGQSAIGNPRILTPHSPTHEELYDTIIHHLQMSIAYEIRRIHNMKQNSDNQDTPLIHNQQIIHQQKKQSENDDTIHNTHKQILPHTYILQMPTRQEIREITQKLDLQDPRPYKACIEFRKYLFNYIKGIPNSKYYKQEIAKTHNYKDLVILIKNLLL